jgi:UDP-N-acetylglucosamine 2-epimerase (non-hydrolysing)
MMRPLSIACIVGARPNFIKMAPIMAEFERRPNEFNPTLVHTGQHYDEKLSHVFFEQLRIPEPNYHLDVGAGTPAMQTAAIIERFDALCACVPFDRILVVGDVTSTLSCAVVAAKRQIPVDHVEAGLRSFDRTMPEEINRIVTDSLADLLFVTEPSGVSNLLREGHDHDQIRLVGNVMIDSLHNFLDDAVALDIPGQFGLKPGEYGVVTLHRPSNVDDPQRLNELLDMLTLTSRQLPLVFPVHPRTQARLGDLIRGGTVHFVEPLGYLEFLGLTRTSALVITDSGGIQEETTAMHVPCLTLRPNTERPITVNVGTNTLLGDHLERVPGLVAEILGGHYKQGTVPELWDGHTSQRIADELILRDNSRSCDSGTASDPTL